MSLVEHYLSLTKKWKGEYGEKTLVLMQVGSFFEVYALVGEDGKRYGSNIEEFARICDMAISNKKTCVGKLQVVMAGFGLAQLDKYVKKLQESSYTTAIYTQDVQGSNTTRSLAEIISPGTFFSQDNTNITNNIMCIWLDKSGANKIMKSKITVGIANLDIYTGRTSVFQFSSDYYHNPCTYDELERYVAIYKPRECIIVSNMDESVVNDVIGYASIECDKLHKITTDGTTQVSKFAKNAEKQIYQQETMNKFYPHKGKSEVFESFTDNYIAIQSFTFLLDYIYQQSPNLVRKLSVPVFDNYTDRLVLANHSLKQLNIIDDSRHVGKMRCVGTMLNNCVTNMGKRHFTYVINNPVTNISSLNDSYDITEHVLVNGSWNVFRDKLSCVNDIEKMTRKLVLNRVSPKDFSMLVSDLDIIGSLYNNTQKASFFELG